MNRNEKMTVAQHTSELRYRAATAAVVFAGSFAVLFWHSQQIVDDILRISGQTPDRFICVAPEEMLVQRLRVASYGAGVLAAPVLLIEFLCFLAPAFENHRMACKAAGGIAAVWLLFCAGASFSLFLIAPVLSGYLLRVTAQSPVTAAVSVRSYLDFLLAVTLGMGVFFEIPPVCVILDRMGLVTAQGLRKKRPVVIVAAFLIGGWITPPDVLSQFLVALPMSALYQTGIWLAAAAERRRKMTGGGYVCERKKESEK